MSAAIAADDPAYRMRAALGGFSASSPAQHLHVRFTRSSVSIASGGLSERLNLRAVGQGGALSAVGEAHIRARANRLTYARGPLGEWYRNGPLGLEQGFTLARPPGARRAGPLTLSFALAGNARVALGAGGTSLVLSHRGTRSLRYGSLIATDARGRRLRSWLQLDGARLLLRVDTRAARYPVRIDPLLQQAAPLTSNEIGSHFGRSVSLSADGNTALVGAPLAHSEKGDAWVFTRSGESWSEGKKLEGSGVSSKAYFGRGVALSADGSRALIGAPGQDENHGAAWVFTRPKEGWTEQTEPEQAKLEGAGEQGEGDFGRSVALSAEGGTALVGGFGDNGEVGAAWVFTRSGESWAQQGAKLTASDESGAGGFGHDLALSADGSTALIAGPYDNGELGAAWVFTRSGESWAQQGAKLIPTDEVGKARFGSGVALSSDAGTALIGGAHDNGVGAAWVFTRSGESWAQQGAKLIPTDEMGEGRFGASVALSAHGGTALVGGFADNGGTGAAWVFTRSGTAWTQQGTKLTAAGEEGPAQFGYSVALSADAATALIGGLSNNEGRGTAWVFAGEPEPPAEEKEETEETEGETPKPGEGPKPSGGTAKPAHDEPPEKEEEEREEESSGGARAAQNQAPPPVLAVSGDITLESGIVLVRLPGSSVFVRLTGSMRIPFGAIIDATQGAVTVTTVGPHGTKQTARYSGGRFLLTQAHDGTVSATLVGGNFSSCPKRTNGTHPPVAKGKRARAARRRSIRKLWTNAHGRFTTRGHFAAGAVQGTEWLTEDSCEGTLIAVTRDQVRVTDLVHHRQILVRAGRRYFARAR